MLGVQGQLVKRGPHVCQPRIPLGLADSEVHMPHPQSGVAAPFVVRGRTAPVLDQEQPQVFLRWTEIPARVDRPQLRIGLHLRVEPLGQPTEGLLAADGVEETDFWPAGPRCALHDGV